MQVVILSGFLGSGKTSLLMGLARFLAREATKGDAPRVIILENEVGDKGVDDALLKNRGFQVENLFAGCACCTVGGELIRAVSYIEETYVPDWMILETTGLAYPGLIRDNLKAACNKDCRICTVVDAQRWKRIRKPMETLLTGQISCADVTLINKTDLATEEEIKLCETDIYRIQPETCCVRTCATDGQSDNVWKLVLGEDNSQHKPDIQ